MDRHTIYCTEEQTTKAIELGAPIIKAENYRDLYNNRWCFVEGIEPPVIVPTAEQMIGWLEEQGIWIHFCKPNQRPELLSFSVSNIKEPFRRVFVGGEYNSREEATLKAIDAALDYMANKKVG